MGQVIGGCPLDCPDACSWIVTVDDEGRAVRLRGNPDHPFTRGGLCVKVNPYLRHVARDDRLLRPLRRVGAKGEGQFVPIPWDDAIDEMASRLGEVIDEWGGEAIWPYAGTGNVGWIQGSIGAGKRLFHHLGASQHAITICSVSGHVGMSYTTGSAAGMDPEDLARSELVLLWGTNTLTSNQHLWPFVERARARGAEVVVVDPVTTRTARRADRHVAPRPGTDGALALGLMRHVADVGATDDAWLAARTTGWEEFRDTVLARWPPARAAAVCGLDTDTVVELAELVARHRPTGIRSSMGMQRHAGGGQASRVLSCIPAVTGDFGRRGGGICYSTAAAYGLDHAALVRPDLMPEPTRVLPMTRLGQGLLDLDDPPVKALVVWAANPVVSHPDQDRVRRGLSRDDLFCVVVEHFMTDTADYADLVLPSTMQIEHLDVHDSFSHLYVQLNRPAVAARGEALPHTEIFRRLAAAMGVTEPAVLASDEELARDVIESDHPAMAGITFEALSERGWARLGGDAPYAPFADRFPTASGRFEFASDRAEREGAGRLPHYVPPSEATAADVERDGSFALVAAADHHLLNSTFGDSADHARAGEPTVVVHPADAGAVGLADGTRVRIGNERGSFTATLVVADTVRRGVAATTKGHWARGGSTVNATVVERDSDMGRGAVYHDNRVWILTA